MADKAKLAPNNINMLNTARTYTSLAYQDRIPVATRENIASVSETILKYSALRNEFAIALVEQIMYQRIEETYFKNPIQLKRDPMRYGASEEEIFINMAKGYQFNPNAGVAEMFAFYQSNVMAAYHHLTPAMQYAVSISYNELRTAFRSDYGVKTLIDGKIAALFSGAEYDEYLCMMELVVSAYNNQTTYPVQVSAVQDATSGAAITRGVKAAISHMRFPHPEYNIAGATSTSYPGGIFYMVNPEVDAFLDVDVLANAYHDDKVDIRAQKILVDKFDNPAIQLVLFDMRWFNVREHYRTLNDTKNGAANSYNYFYTVDQMYSYSPFFNMIVFTTDTVGTTGITITPVANYTPSQDIAITATATHATATYIPQIFDYAVSGNTSSFTSFVPGSNILHIANDEVAANLTVTVTNRYAPTVTASITIPKK